MTTKRKPGSHDSTRLECVIHYSTLQTDHTELTPLNDTSYSTLLQAKDIQKELGGEHYHADQCTSIPTPQYDDSMHGIHRRCYRKFTKAKRLLKRNGVQMEMKVHLITISGQNQLALHQGRLCSLSSVVFVKSI